MHLGTEPGDFVAQDRYQYGHASYWIHRQTDNEFAGFNTVHTSSLRIPVRKLPSFPGKLFPTHQMCGKVFHQNW